MRAAQTFRPAQSLTHGWVVIGMPGQAGWGNYPDIREAMCGGLRTCAQQQRTGVVVDFTGTVLTDSSALVSLARTGTRAGLLNYPIRLVVPNLSVHLRHVLDSIGLAAALPVFSSVHCAVSTARPPTPPADPAVMQHALHALQKLRLTTTEPASLLGPPIAPLPDNTASNQDLIISMASAKVRPLRLRLEGALTHGNIRHLGDALTSLIDRSLHHLRIESWPTSGQVEVLPVLLGIRWRAATNGGCLHLPSPPDWLRHLLHREELLQTFTPCATCTPVLISPHPETDRTLVRPARRQS